MSLALSLFAAMCSGNLAQAKLSSEQGPLSNDRASYVKQAVDAEMCRLLEINSEIDIRSYLSVDMYQTLIGKINGNLTPKDILVLERARHLALSSVTSAEERAEYTTWIKDLSGALNIRIDEGEANLDDVREAYSMEARQILMRTLNAATEGRGESMTALKSEDGYNQQGDYLDLKIVAHHYANLIFDEKNRKLSIRVLSQTPHVENRDFGIGSEFDENQLSKEEEAKRSLDSREIMILPSKVSFSLTITDEMEQISLEQIERLTAMRRQFCFEK